MKRVALVVFTILLMTSVLAVAASATNNFPAQPPVPVAVANPAPVASGLAPRPGYVPPAPIRHTWPGGYRVIIHELMNTLTEHILGQY